MTRGKCKSAGTHRTWHSLWDVDFQTAVAQAEVEDRTVPGVFHHLRFGVEGDGSFVVATTRPELLAACVAVVAHPDDARYQSLFGRRAITPLFRIPVPILPDECTSMDKGTGILMVCTFGDAMNVEWWRQFNLPLRQVIGKDGRLLPVHFGTPGWESLAHSCGRLSDRRVARAPSRGGRSQLQTAVVPCSAFAFGLSMTRPTGHAVP